MKADHIALVQDSFAKVVPIADTAAALFYQRLFELDEDLRPMFHPDMDQQRRLLMKMIAIAVERLDDLDSLVPVVQNLGQRHRGYGVEPSHYDSVGDALLWTLEQGLGESTSLRTWPTPGRPPMGCLQVSCGKPPDTPNLGLRNSPPPPRSRRLRCAGQSAPPPGNGTIASPQSARGVFH